ncbi:MAG TPA: 2-oxoglutarate dehydrogenase E1 component, partial [Xanthomonadales bacterium]|nr:2-oxoglutarate dehydrogenase E1 component [Xanthomonadales bacterium]
MASLIEEFAASSHVSGGNAAFVEGLYEQFLADPAAVAPGWRAYFEALKGREAGDVAHGPIVADVARARRVNGRAPAVQSAESGAAQKQGAVSKMVTAYRSRGHLAANLDPLGLAPRPAAPDLDPAFHGLTDADLDTEFSTGSFG